MTIGHLIPVINGRSTEKKKKKRLATAIVETTHYARSPKWIIVKLWSTNRIQESKDAKETHHKFNIQDNSNWLQTTNCTWIFLVQFNIWLCSCPAHHEKLMIGQSSECWQRVHFLKLRSEINALGLFWVAHWLLVVCQYQSDSVSSSRRGGWRKENQIHRGHHRSRMERQFREIPSPVRH